MKLIYKNRPVEVEVELASSTCDSYFASGAYTDDDTDLTDDELYEMADIFQQELCEYCMERQGGWRD